GNRRDIIPTMMLFHLYRQLLVNAIVILALIVSTGGRSGVGCAEAAETADQSRADLIIHHGKIVTIDKQFTIHQAMAVQDGRILRVGSNEQVLQTKGPQTKLLDLNGKTVL